MSWDNFNLSFYGLCVILFWIAARGIVGGGTVIAYPTLAAMMGLAWIVPQGIELEADPWNSYSSEAFWLYVTVCFLFILFGFRTGNSSQRRRIARAPDRAIPSFSKKRLLVAAAGLTALGLLSAFQMRGIDTSSMGGQWTGVITMWAMLAKASGFGLCLAVLVFARTQSWMALAIAAVAVVPLFNEAILGVRREAMFDLVILTVGAWYISKDRFPPRAIVIAGLILGTVVLNTIGDIRERVQSQQVSFIEALVTEETYRNFNYTAVDQGASSEVGQAQYDFWYANQTWRWELGSEYWNSLVHQYVPAFLLGRDFKEGLKISTLSARLRAGEEKGAFALGSTRTGFSDSYRAFGIIGALVFWMIGYGFGILYANSKSGSVFGQYFYLVLIAEGLKAITHGTTDLLASLPFTVVISLLGLRFAQIHRHSRDTAAESNSARLGAQPSSTFILVDV